jgi:uncharacterized protein YbjT (DUF2867 family)
VRAGEAFVAPLSNLVWRAPVFPLFGHGEPRLQPAHVEDVAEAIVARPPCKGRRRPSPMELAGPRVFTYAELLATIADAAGRKPLLVPVPFALWHVLGFAGEFLPTSPITRSQIELMRIDNVAAPDVPGFAALGISPQPLEEMLSQMSRRSEPG